MKTIEQIKARRRLNLTLLSENYGAARLAEKLGIAPTYLYQLTKAEGKAGRGLGDHKAREFERTMGLVSGWLDEEPDIETLELYAKAPKFERPAEVVRSGLAGIETTGQYVQFPLVEGFAGMGVGDYIADYPEVVESLRVSREWVERKLPGVPPEAIRVITGRGDSMRGQYNDGDLIFVDTRIKRFDQDSAYCFRWEGRVLIKRLQFIGKGMLRILSKNPDYPAIDAPMDEIEIGGRALAAWTLKEF